jgi:hypothetical protein
MASGRVGWLVDEIAAELGATPESRRAVQRGVEGAMAGCLMPKD